MTEQTNEIKNYPTVEKQMSASGIPFKVLKAEPRDNWLSNYAYYLKQKTANASLRPLIGRMDGEQFQVLGADGWSDKDLWDDYSEEVIENGEQVLNAKGNVRKRLLFDNKKEWLVQFESPIVVNFWDKELKQRVNEQHDTVWIRLSKNLSGKLEDELNDPRNSMESYFKIFYDNKKSPADQYKVKFVK